MAKKDNDMIFATGPAGSGKTYMSIALAVRSLKNKEIRKIILSRPAVEAGEKLGFLPGDILRPEAHGWCCRRPGRKTPRSESLCDEPFSLLQIYANLP